MARLRSSLTRLGWAAIPLIVLATDIAGRRWD
jgi:hypothetical protein